MIRHGSTFPETLRERERADVRLLSLSYPFWWPCHARRSRASSATLEPGDTSRGARAECVALLSAIRPAPEDGETLCGSQKLLRGKQTRFPGRRSSRGLEGVADNDLPPGGGQCRESTLAADPLLDTVLDPAMPPGKLPAPDRRPGHNVEPAVPERSRKHYRRSGRRNLRWPYDPFVAGRPRVRHLHAAWWRAPQQECPNRPVMRAQ